MPERYGGPIDDAPWPPSHVLFVMEGLERRIVRDMGRQVLAHRPDIDTAYPGWRARWMRVLSMVPPEGATLTALAGILDMTKQSAAQVVGELVAAGLVASDPHPDDRRAVVLRRTAEGRRLAVEVHEAVVAMQDEWAAQVGPRRFATFLAVMDELGLSSSA